MLSDERVRLHLEQLKAPSAEVRSDAAAALGEMGPEALAAVPALTAALRDADLLQITWRENGCAMGFDVFTPPLCAQPNTPVLECPHPEGSVCPSPSQDRNRSWQLPWCVNGDGRAGRP